MGKRIVLVPGDKFNNLTFVEMAESRNGCRRALFRCDCDKEQERFVSEVTSGRSKSCGCSRKPTTIPGITKYGMLTYIEDRPGKPRKCLFFCDCGGEIVRPLKDVKYGTINSCGCLHKSVLEPGITKYGRLTYLRDSDCYSQPRKCVFMCDCGEETTKDIKSVKSGGTKSCGCYNIEILTTHSMTGTPTYQSWDAMIQRCTNPNNKHYYKYGKRGITVCPEWLNSFQIFYEDMGERPPGMTLDRHPSKDGNYEKDNCRWATPKQQGEDKRDSMVWSVGGKEYYSAKDAADDLGVTENKVRIMCKGSTTKVSKKFTPPLDGCSVRYRYPELMGRDSP